MTARQRIIRIALFSITTAFLTVLPLLAALTGDIFGSVSDPQGLPVENAKITVSSLGTGVLRTLTTGPAGDFSVLQLEVGGYEIRVEKPGFRVTSVRISVRSAEAAKVNLVLTLGSLSETVTVSEQSLLDVTNAQLTVSLDAQTIQALPSINQDIVAFAALSPGIVPVSNDNPFFRSGSFNANGQRGRSNNITIDNAIATDVTTTDASGTRTFSLDSVQEFKLVTSNFSAEFGRNTGSQLQIITKAGTNEYHGSAYWFNQNSVFNARDFFDTTGKATPLNQNLWGLTAGGPIERNHLFVFGDYQGIKTRGAGSTRVASVLTPDNAAGIVNATSLNLFRALGAPESSTGHLNSSAPNAGNQYSWSLRVDDYFRGGKDFVTARYGTNPQSSVTPALTFLGTNLPNFGAQIIQTDQILNIGYTHRATPSIVNQLRFEFERTTPTFSPFTNLAAPFAPLIAISGFDPMGVSSILPQGRVQNVFQYSDVLSWSTGRHAFKFGADVFRYRVDTLFNANFRGTFTFGSLADFQNGIPQSYSQAIGNSVRRYRSTDVSSFVQDDIRITPTFVLNVGLRFESEGGVSEASNILANLDVNSHAPLGGGGTGPLGSIDLGGQAYRRNNNWAPRVGAAWNPHHGKFVLRAGYGWAYDYLFLNPVVNIAFSPPFISSISLIGTSINGGDSYANLVAGTASSQNNARAAIGAFSPTQFNFGGLSAIQQGLKNPKVEQYELGFEYQFLKHLVVKATYIGDTSKFLQVSLPINLVSPQNRPVPAVSEADELARFSSFSGAFSAESGTANGLVINNRIDPRFNSVTQVQSIGTASYNALQITVLERVSSFTFQGSYTYGHSIDDTSDALAVLVNDSPQVQDPRNFRANRASSAFDLTHRFVFSGVLNIPWTRRFSGHTAQVLHGWSLAGILTAQSGLPASIFSGSRRGISDVALLGGGTVRANGDASAFHPAPFGSPAAAAIPAPSARGINLNGTSTFTNTSGFPLTQPLLGNLGTSGRNQLRLDDLWNVDVSVAKTTHITETLNLQFRWEIYNVFNHANFSGFTSALTSPLFGTYTSTATNQRKMQFGLRFQF